jgi:hypothetical protein
VVDPRVEHLVEGCFRVLCGLDLLNALLDGASDRPGSKLGFDHHPRLVLEGRGEFFDLPGFIGEIQSILGQDVKPSGRGIEARETHIGKVHCRVTLDPEREFVPWLELESGGSFDCGRARFRIAASVSVGSGVTIACMVS